MTIKTKSLGRILTLLIFVLCSATLWQCKPRGEDNDQKTVDPPAKDVIILKAGKLTSTIKIPGELMSFRDVDLYAKVNSFCKQLYVDIGSEVKEGQILALMEAPEIASQLVAAESRLKSQQAIYQASKASYDRLSATSKTPGTISQNDLDQASAKMNSDKAQLEAAEAFQREISTMRNYLEIRAPFDGVISARNVSLGAYVGPSGKGSEFPMFVLNEQKRLRLVVYVPEAYSNYLRANDEIQFTIKAFPNQKFTAKVKRLAGALDKRLRAQRIEMDVSNDNKKLLPGMIAEVSLFISTDDNTWIVPRTAVVNSTERIFVICIRDHVATWIEVQKGLEANQEIEVFGKLNAGDQLIKVATEEIREGSKIDQVKATN